MNKLSTQRRVQVISALVEGMSIRSVVRMTGVSKNAVVKLLEDVGNACAIYQDKVFRNLTCKRIECDEIWSFVHAKEGHLPQELQGVFGYGDVYTWVAIDAETKLVPCWNVGRRDAESGMAFVKDLSERVTNRFQLSTDGFKLYLTAVEEAFGADIDYGMVVKIYGVTEDDANKRYSPAKCIGCEKQVVAGNPDMNLVSTSFVERQNLTMRMGMRRFTRLTNGFSKKIENHMHAVALHYMHYNFCRIHKTLRCTPAMEANVTKKLWSIEDIVALLD
ncbi:MAG TPA: IS1 family transposase [Pyrinomonadaceae bacterium]|nr:IS1 family transposase [Pyrinomonadaceae bacterium]